LPPREAPLAVKLDAAMARAGISPTDLAAALGTDRSLVHKWLGGEVKRITSARHRKRLPEILDTPARYFSPGSTPELWDMVTDLEARVKRIERSVGLDPER
jgi:transcriptional regulator with XRE-family HTH domain